MSGFDFGRRLEQHAPLVERAVNRQLERYPIAAMLKEAARAEQLAERAHIPAERDLHLYTAQRYRQELDRHVAP